MANCRRSTMRSCAYLGERGGRAGDFSTLKARDVDYRGLGRAYVEKSIAFIESGTPRGALDESVPFIDKMPQNFAYIGFIFLALPKAKVIVTERKAMDTCLSNFKQLYKDPFYRFSYRLDEMGQYFIAYHRLMRHWMGLSVSESIRSGTRSSSIGRSRSPSGCSSTADWSGSAGILMPGGATVPWRLRARHRSGKRSARIRSAAGSDMSDSCRRFWRN